MIASTDPKVLTRSEDAPAPPKENETPEEKGTQAEVEEEAREERREQKAAVRRAYYDIAWLIHHTAEACRDQLAVSGGALTWMAEMVHDTTHEPFQSYAQYWEPRNQIEDEMEKASGKVKESLTRQLMLAQQFSDKINTPYDPREMFDWPVALEAVSFVAEELSLRLPKGWDQPPIHQTATNCHVCGRFTSLDHVTKRDESEGWRVEGDFVTCSDECRARLSKQALAKSKKGKSSK